ncbi:unnamed protein product [Prunus brigantina]
MVVQPTHKFDLRAQCCVFVGYPTGQKGYKLYNLETKKFLPHFPPPGLDDADRCAQYNQPTETSILEPIQPSLTELTAPDALPTMSPHAPAPDELANLDSPIGPVSL